MNDPAYFQSDGHLTELAVALYAEHLLHASPAVPASVVLHVESCDECKGHILAVTDLVDAPSAVTAGRERSAEHTEQASVVIPLWYRAAAVLLLMLGGYGMYHLAADFPVTQEYTAVADPPQLTPSPLPNTPAESTEPMPATDRWTPSANFEDLLNTHYRSRRFDIIAPRNGETLVLPYRFRWSTDATPLQIDFLTNTEETVFSVESSNSSYLLQKEFPNGRYYWRVTVKDEMVYLGSFFIGRP